MNNKDLQVLRNVIELVFGEKLIMANSSTQERLGKRKSIMFSTYVFFLNKYYGYSLTEISKEMAVSKQLIYYYINKVMYINKSNDSNILIVKKIEDCRNYLIK